MKSPIYLLMTTLAVGVMLSCNSDPSPVVFEDYEYNNLIVSSFSLQADDSVVSGLDSVFFSVDLDQALVFNADSLPKGTRINRLRVTLGLPTVSEAELIFRSDNGTDTVNYLTNPNDSIDFSYGDVKLHLKSYSGSAERDYLIRVNVHQLNPDSLWWNQEASCTMPTALSTVTAGRAIMHRGKVTLFTSDGASLSVAVNENPYDVSGWEVSAATLPAGGDINTMSSLGDDLFVSDGTVLWRSSDLGSTWQSTGVDMSHIYGGYSDMLLGVRKDADGKYWHTTYPVSNETPVPDGCPVSGTSLPLSFTTEWSGTPMMFVIGGRTASGELTGEMWGYDAGEWARVSRNGVPEGENLIFFPYFSFVDRGNWRITERSTLFTVSGGKTYISRNRGIVWQLAEEALQMPSYMPEMRLAQAIVIPATLGELTPEFDSRSWVELPALTFPGFSRASVAITEWECPYIYVFGGIDSDGKYSDKIWRGVINRLSFKPLQ